MKPELQGKLNLLSEKRKTIYHMIEGKRKLLDVQYRNLINEKNSNMKIKIYDTINELREEIDKNEIEIDEIDNLTERLKMLSWHLIGSNQKIDLYKTDESIVGSYFIYLHESYDEVGYISYEPKYKNTKYGDISYDIDCEYQGNGYAYEALCILSNYLKNKNVNFIRLAVNKNNIPSVKTIEKYKGINSNVTEMDSEDNFKIYDFRLNKRLVIRK